MLCNGVRKDTVYLILTDLLCYLRNKHSVSVRIKDKVSFLTPLQSIVRSRITLK